MLSRLKVLGPGLLYAGAAVGVSHIVQSTRAGAEYGYVLIIAIVLVHLFKYPFFELGPKYTQYTGHNLLRGYARLGKWSLAIVAVLTVATMFTIQAAVTIVTAGLALKITGAGISAVAMSAILLLICFAISAIGRFSVLDRLMKVIMITLSITTIVALVSSFFAHPEIVDANARPKVFNLTDNLDLIFLVTLLGWMPAPLDISIWHSIWSEEKIKMNEIGENRESMFDFKVGYWGTAILGIFFLVLGANVVYGTGAVLSVSAGAYAKDLIDIYTQSIGGWSYWIIAIAAFTTMFSTTLTCLDAMPRVLTQIGKEWKRHDSADEGIGPDSTGGNTHIHRIIWTLVIAVGSVLLLYFFIENMKDMVTVATVFSFLTAPILAVLGILIVKKHLPKDFWPGWKYLIAFSGVILLSVLGIYYLVL